MKTTQCEPAKVIEERKCLVKTTGEAKPQRRKGLRTQASYVSASKALLIRQCRPFCLVLARKAPVGGILYRFWVSGP